MNRLNQTQSPYLRQHADNPVHWQPWDEQALAQAQREDKPILLSVGYAACHWCHVMEHESFTDKETAAQMNADFVNIKVDREERPDIDRIYQAAHYVFTRANGGWPLTMFLTPTGTPFFGGTYFPKQSRHDLPSFSGILQRVAAAWRDNREAIEQQNAQVLPLLRGLDDHATTTDNIDDTVLTQAMTDFLALFDGDNGGLGDAPKFPHPVELAFCLEAAIRTRHTELTAAVRLSLQRIATAGLADHLGGGFFRYCVDAGWGVPHFEKMLYDNGLLLAVFADAGDALPLDDARRAAAHTANWVISEMRDDNGAFYSSLDADTADGEGAFYLWGRDELTALLTTAEYAVVSSHYGLAAAATVEGKWHLAGRQTAAQTAAATALSPDQTDTLLRQAKEKLTTARQQRQRPATDDKILTAWNALMIRGLARAGRRMAREEWTAAAAAAFADIAGRRANGRSIAARRQNHVSAAGFLDDVAFLLDAALELLRADFSAAVLNAAQSLAEELLTHFEDRDNGGFFFTADDGERLIRRLKTADDNAIPNGNGIACRALLTLSWLVGERRYHDAAQRALRAFYDGVRRRPTGAASLLAAMQSFLSPPTLVFLSGAKDVCRQWQHELEKEYNPDTLVYCLPSQQDDLPPTLRKPAATDKVHAYLCNGFSCLPPTTDLAEIKKTLNTQSGSVPR